MTCRGAKDCFPHDDSRYWPAPSPSGMKTICVAPFRRMSVLAAVKSNLAYVRNHGQSMCTCPRLLCSVNAHATLGWHAWHRRRQKKDGSDSKIVTVLLRKGGHLNWRGLIDRRVPRLWTAMGSQQWRSRKAKNIRFYYPLAAGFPDRDPSTPVHSRQIELDGSDGCSASDDCSPATTETIGKALNAFGAT